MHALPQHAYPVTHAMVQCPAPLELPELPPPELEDELALDPAPLLPLELEPPELPLLELLPAEPELPLAEPELLLELPLAEPELLFELPLADHELPPPSVVASLPPPSVDASLPAVNTAPPQWDAATRATNEAEPKQRDSFIDAPNSPSRIVTRTIERASFGPKGRSPIAAACPTRQRSCDEA